MGRHSKPEHPTTPDTPHPASEARHTTYSSETTPAGEIRSATPGTVHSSSPTTIPGTAEDGLADHTAALRLSADIMIGRLTQAKSNPNRADDVDPIVVPIDEFSNNLSNNVAVAFGQLDETYRATKEEGEPPTSPDIGILLRTARAGNLPRTPHPQSEIRSDTNNFGELDG